MNSQDTVPCVIRWGYRFTAGEYQGKVGIHADIPLECWPVDEDAPTYRSTYSVWEDGRLVPGKPWETFVPFESYYQPVWMRAMWPGSERWRLYKAFEAALRAEVERITADLWVSGDGIDKLPESRAGELVIVQLPDKAAMLQRIGQASPPATV